MKERIILYHRIMRRENFEKAAKDLFNLLKTAHVKCPDMDRVLYVDIDGHKNPSGGYDRDMLELQKDFGLGFLGKFFSEIHFPLIDVMNSHPQCNDIPEKLEILSQEKYDDKELSALYIENYSNTEFVSEPDVYSYLQKVHNFLVRYREFDVENMIKEENKSDSAYHIRLWKNHICELINELYNAFIHGNLFSVAAMTRTLIECFVYYSIIAESGNGQLTHHWYVCNLCYTQKDDEKLRDMVREYCHANNLDFNEMWSTYSVNPNTKRWLKPIMPQGKPLNFETYCNYLGEEHIYEDYESACAFVHGQDLTAKILPFTFYSSICYRFDMMMLYIFCIIHLFPLNESMEEQLVDLEEGLAVLSEKYLQ